MTMAISVKCSSRLFMVFWACAFLLNILNIIAVALNRDWFSTEGLFSTANASYRLMVGRLCVGVGLGTVMSAMLAELCWVIGTDWSSSGVGALRVMAFFGACFGFTGCAISFSELPTGVEDEERKVTVELGILIMASFVAIALLLCAMGAFSQDWCQSQADCLRGHNYTDEDRLRVTRHSLGQFGNWFVERGRRARRACSSALRITDSDAGNILEEPSMASRNLSVSPEEVRQKVKVVVSASSQQSVNPEGDRQGQARARVHMVSAQPHLIALGEDARRSRRKLPKIVEEASEAGHSTDTLVASGQTISSKPKTPDQAAVVAAGAGASGTQSTQVAQVVAVPTSGVLETRDTEPAAEAKMKSDPDQGDANGQEAGAPNADNTPPSLKELREKGDEQVEENPAEKRSEKVKMSETYQGFLSISNGCSPASSNTSLEQKEPLIRREEDSDSPGDSGIQSVEPGETTAVLRHGTHPDSAPHTLARRPAAGARTDEKTEL